MPVTKSAAKALRKTKRKTHVNKIIRGKIKRAIKLASQKPTLANFKSAVSVLDRASKKKVIHKNKATRLKSRLAKLLRKK